MSPEAEVWSCWSDRPLGTSTLMICWRECGPRNRGSPRENKWDQITVFANIRNNCDLPPLLLEIDGSNYQGGNIQGGNIIV